MRQPGKDAPLATEARLHLVEVEPSTDQLDRDGLGEIGILPLTSVDDAHPASTDARLHAKGTESLSEQRVRTIGWIAVGPGGLGGRVAHVLQHRLDPLPQFGRGSTAGIEEARAIRRGDIERIAGYPQGLEFECVQAQVPIRAAGRAGLLVAAKP
jgi:hypothetical protein